MALYGMVAWAPEYLRRTFGVETSVAGYQIGLVLVRVRDLRGRRRQCVLSDHLLRRGIAAARLIILAAAGVLASPVPRVFLVRGRCEDSPSHASRARRSFWPC